MVKSKVSLAGRKFVVYFASGAAGRFMVDNSAKLVKVLFEVETGAELEISSSWHSTPVEIDPGRAIRVDLANIQDSDFLVAFHPGGEGTSAEMGYALGCQKTVLFCADSQHLDDRLFVSYHPFVHLVTADVPGEMMIILIEKLIELAEVL